MEHCGFLTVTNGFFIVSCEYLLKKHVHCNDTDLLQTIASLAQRTSHLRGVARCAQQTCTLASSSSWAVRTTIRVAKFGSHSCFFSVDRHGGALEAAWHQRLHNLPRSSHWTRLQPAHTTLPGTELSCGDRCRGARAGYRSPRLGQQRPRQGDFAERGLAVCSPRASQPFPRAATRRLLLLSHGPSPRHVRQFVDFRQAVFDFS